jgi:hypothetical protein
MLLNAGIYHLQNRLQKLRYEIHGQLKIIVSEHCKQLIEIGNLMITDYRIIKNHDGTIYILIISFFTKGRCQKYFSLKGKPMILKKTDMEVTSSHIRILQDIIVLYSKNSLSLKKII